MNTAPSVTLIPWADVANGNFVSLPGRGRKGAPLACIRYADLAYVLDSGEVVKLGKDDLVIDDGVVEAAPEPWCRHERPKREVLAVLVTICDPERIFADYSRAALRARTALLMWPWQFRQALFQMHWSIMDWREHDDGRKLARVTGRGIAQALKIGLLPHAFDRSLAHCDPCR